jgi:DNA helicase II / ATP-dependent DNA helicase PcrA
MNLDDLNESQRKAVTFTGKHLLVLAGAGTGKTKTIISRAAYLISQGVNPGKIQILTFTKRSASEIVSRVKASLTINQAQTLNGSTFHSWCNQLLTKYPNLFGTKSFTVIDEDDQVSIMKIVCGKKDVVFEDIRIKPQGLIDLYSFSRNTKRNLTETIRFKLFNNLFDSETEEKIKVLKGKLEVILRDYEQRKKERKYLDYDDIIQVVATRMKVDEQAKKLISSQYEHILVDEMQDTNPLQWEFLEPFQDICCLFCVGDDAQSIYSFRGADFRNVHLFTERVKDSEIYKLEDNYRSTQEILDISNWILEKSTINYNKKLHAVRGNGFLPTIMNVNNEWDEARWIADKIIEYYTQKNKIYADHLVLSRSGFYTRTLEAIFIQKKIPYIKFGGRKFMESAHIKDVFSSLRIVNNYDDEIAWIRFLTLWEGIGEIKASKYINELLNFKNIQECITWLYTIHKNDINVIIPEILKSILNNQNDVQKALICAHKLMEKRLSIIYKTDWENKRRPDFPVLSVLASNYSNLGEFITECLLDASPKVSSEPALTLSSSELLRTEIENDKVIISTIHSAKGLESDICFIVNVSPKAFPSTISIGNIDEIEEDRRILYVALTRAKNELIITRKLESIHAENRITTTESSPNENNAGAFTVEEQYFLNGLPDEIAEQGIIETQRREVKDLDKPNSLGIEYGMDFS